MSVDRSFSPAGYLLSFSTYEITSLVSCKLSVPGASAGIVEWIRSNKSPTDSELQFPRNSRPTSVGPASPPINSAPWQLTHILLAMPSPRLAGASLYTPLQIPEPPCGAAACVPAVATACACTGDTIVAHTH